MTATIRALLVPAYDPPKVIQVDPTWQSVAVAIKARWIERVRTPLVDVVMWVDEEGATTIGVEQNCWVTGPTRLYRGDIYGDVLITGEVMADDGPDYAGLTDEQLIAVLGRVDVSPRHLPDLMAGIEVR